MARQYATVGSPITVTATGAAVSGPCSLIGLFCNSTSSGTIILYDNTAASGQVIVGTLTPTAGVYYLVPASCANGIYATVGNTLNVTLFVAQG
jgi:hypothetical protein